jgi:signal peptidase I
MEVAERRGSDSVILIGLLLGPISLMLWLGKGRLAGFYLLFHLVVFGIVFVATVTGVIAPIMLFDSVSWTLFLLSLPVTIAAFIHGMLKRRVWLERPWYSRWYVAVFLPIAASLLIAFVIRTFLFQPFHAPSGNMIPSLMVGDYFLVSKTAYGEPQRGDIVAFEHPRDGTTYVMRLIGLPGDRFQLREGVVTLNGEELTLTRVHDIPCIEGERCNFFRETLPGGRSYVINNAEPNGQADNTNEYVVPAGHYYMLGDNRDNSFDSRFLQIGDIPYENLVGPAVLVYWNSHGFRIDDRLRGYPGK